ncbi:GGDEF domain-containing protein [Vibrio salinus]|uniref:GGDEF domain-containing protein n=1 Tax=Vibrio salinus TaxID=2899784 RepID=UPI001E635EC4|nr:GGDEF domain-containing protein [Vibrio salinus]MCE0493253.1 GGDEF domain-containing protein [Vibrio salinus]
MSTHDMYTKPTTPMNNNALSISGMYDPLTQLYNKELFTQVADSLLRISIRQKMPVSLAMIYFAHYASLKDKYGNSAADNLIRESAHLLQSISRDSDVLSHYSEDKFALLLYNCNYISSKIVAERIQKHVKEDLGNQQHEVSITIGLAEFDARYASSKDNISDQLVHDALESLTKV